MLDMEYYSTRDSLKKQRYSLKEASFMGLAPDGGLFMPVEIPLVDLDKVLSLAESSYSDMALYLAELFFEGSVPPDKLKEMVLRAYDYPCPLVEATPGDFALELFHGPTFAFKDFGARFMGGMLGLLGSEQGLTVLTATSGDTGSAVAAGFHNVRGVKVVVLYPEGKVSPLQEAQMTTLGGNIFPLKVRGNFDDCQALVKAVFNDSEFRKSHYVTSANSINILRWIPQSFYYFYAYAQWHRLSGNGEPDIVVPSGNYGNISAGMLAHKMGLPVHRFIAAANANDVIPEFLSSGIYRPRPSIRTIANAMDVGAPSNYERILSLYDNDFSLIKASLEGYSYSDAQIKDGIREIYSRSGYISDPHSATGYLAAKQSQAEGFRLSTAHAAKFREVLSDALPSVEVPLPERLSQAMDKPKLFNIIDKDLKALEDYINSSI